MTPEANPCPSCGALPCDWVNNPHPPSGSEVPTWPELVEYWKAKAVADWQPIATMPFGKWVYVFVPGAGPGFTAIKKPPHGFWGGRIIGLESGKEIHRATHWRPCFLPPVDSMVSTHNLYEGQRA
jgi:hypothetical protein